MLVRSANYFLSRLGWRLVRLENSCAKQKFSIAAAERKAVDDIVKQFARQQSDQQGLLSDAKEWRSYLSNSRLVFFAELVELIVQRNIELEHCRIADFGSGTGYLLRLLHRRFPEAHFTGFDTFAEVNELAAMICPAAEFFPAMNSSENQFDIIFCTEVLEHLNRPGDQLIQLIDALAPKGKLVLTVPNGRTDSQSARKPRKDGAGYWGHIHFWSPESWPMFLHDTLSDKAEIETGQLSSGENFAIVSTG